MHKNFRQYILNREAFEEQLRVKGYKNHLEFCKKTGIHRNTLNYYLSGHEIFPKKFYKIAEGLGVDPKELIAQKAPQIDYLNEIKTIIQELSQKPGVAVVLLGSRANGRAKRYSDWDLGVTAGEKKLSGFELLRLKRSVEVLAEDLPRKVEIINLDAAPCWFLESIDYEPVFLGGDANSYHYFKGVLDGHRKREIDKVA